MDPLFTSSADNTSIDVKDELHIEGERLCQVTVEEWRAQRCQLKELEDRMKALERDRQESDNSTTQRTQSASEALSAESKHSQEDVSKLKSANEALVQKVIQLEDEVLNYKAQVQVLEDERAEKEGLLQTKMEELGILEKEHKTLQDNYQCVKTLSDKRLAKYEAIQEAFRELKLMEVVSQKEESTLDRRVANDDTDKEAAVGDEFQEPVEKCNTNDTPQLEEVPTQQIRRSARIIKPTDYQQLTNQSDSDDLEWELSNGKSERISSNKASGLCKETQRDGMERLLSTPKVASTSRLLRSRTRGRPARKEGENNISVQAAKKRDGKVLIINKNDKRRVKSPDIDPTWVGTTGELKYRRTISKVQHTKQHDKKKSMPSWKNKILELKEMLLEPGNTVRPARRPKNTTAAGTRTRFSAFSIEAILKILERNDTSGLPTQLDCSHYEAMKEGSVLLVRDVYNTASFHIAYPTFGFYLAKSRVTENKRNRFKSGRKPGLARVKRLPDGKFQFSDLTSYGYRVGEHGSRGMSANYADFEFYTSKSKDERYQMNDSDVYLMYHQRVMRLFEQVDPDQIIWVQELLLVKVFNADDKKILEGTAAYQFYRKCQSENYNAIPSRFMPHPPMHDIACERCKEN